MTRLTIVYTDGYQEHYNITDPKVLATEHTIQKRLKDVLDDGMLRLILEDTQLVIIPLVNVRKLIHQSENDIMNSLKVKDYPNILTAKLVEDV